MGATPNYNWPPAGLQPQGWAVIDGVTGAVVKQSGGIFGTFSKPATGNCRVTLTMPIAESELLLGVLVSPDDDGSTARFASYGIDAVATPPELDIYTRDAAGALADAVRVTVAVFAIT